LRNIDVKQSRGGRVGNPERLAIRIQSDSRETVVRKAVIQHDDVSIRIDPLNITTSIMPNGTVGTSYSQPLTATTVHGPVTWTIVSNTGADVSSGNGLPNGLTLNSNGTVSGTPLTSGGFFFTVRARDSLGQKTTRLIALQVQ